MYGMMEMGDSFSMGVGHQQPQPGQPPSSIDDDAVQSMAGAI